MRVFAKSTPIRAAALLVPVLAAALAPAAGAQTLGVTRLGYDDVLVFEADTHNAIGTFSIDLQGSCTNLAVADDQKLAYVTNYIEVLGQFVIWVIDLTTTPPSFAAGTNPIPVFSSALDLELTWDQRYAVLTGGMTGFVEVVDLEARVVISATSVAGRANSVDVASDDTVLVTSWFPNTVSRLFLSDSGVITPTTETFDPVFRPRHVSSVPGSDRGVVVYAEDPFFASFGYPGGVGTFDITDSQALNAAAYTAAFHPKGHRLYVKTSEGLLAYDYDRKSGVIGELLFVSPIASGPGCWGRDMIAVHPGGTRVLTTGGTDPPRLMSFDAGTGELLGTIPLEPGGGLTVALPRAYQESVLLIGRGAGAATHTSQLSRHRFTSQLRSIRQAVERRSADPIRVPLPPVGSPVQRFSVELMMYAPHLFPQRFERSSDRLALTVHPDGTVTGVHAGTKDGISLGYRTVTLSSGLRYLEFTITIDELE